MTATVTPQDQTQTPNDEPPTNGPKKGMPAPIKALLKPLLYLSIGLHGLLLLAPLPSNQKLEIPDEKDTAIKITQLPPAKPSPKLSQPETKSDSNTSGSDTAAADTGSSASSDTGSDTTDYSSSDDGGSGSFTSLSSVAATPPKTYSGSFADFPVYSPSEKGCYGRPDCQTVKGTPIDTVDKYFEKALKEKDFGVEVVRSEPTVKIYKLKGGLEQRYLSILADGANTLYVLSARPVNDLPSLKESAALFTEQPAATSTASPSPGTGGTQTASGQTSINISASSTSTEPLVDIPEELFTLLDDLIPAVPAPDKLPDEYSDAKPAYFAQPNLFYKVPVATSPGQQQASTSTFASDAEPLPGLEKAVYILDIAPEKFYTDSLEQKLKPIFVSVEKVGEHGGGALYEMKQAKDKPLYLNLLPLQKHPTGREGTIVVLWTRDPRPPATSVTGKPIPVPAPSPSPSPTSSTN
ncbi:MAG: hypothetical protein NZ772_16330 [Cyanobacteria bacterium]|nr:hypothetical protein [Cyanobacteriota bacterium]MDW8202901.1 hypothetical protein [Cyanobacteriota bacterium SKYGB_h_bin112]